METYKEFCVQWNNIIPFKLKESDFVMPNEATITRALIYYLEQFGFSRELLEKHQHNEDLKITKKFKVDLCEYINHIYKLGNEKSQPFTYFDLIKPTPKKTYHTLKYLLNYLLFFNMMKVDVIEPTKAKINEYNDITAKHKHDTEKLKRMKQQREKYRDEIPKMDDSIKRLELKERDQNEIRQHLKLTIDDNDLRFNNLKMEEQRLRSEIVKDYEADDIMNKKKNIEEELKEQSEIELAKLEGSRQIKIAINKYEELIKFGESLMEECSLENFDKLCAMQKKQSDLNNTIMVLKSKNNQTKEFIMKNIKKIKEMKNDLGEKDLELKNLKALNEEKNIELQKEIKKEEYNNEQIDLKLHDIEDSLAQEEKIEQTIITAKHVFTTHLGKTSFKLYHF